MTKTCFVVELPSGELRESVVEGERALVGTGGHCDVRLPPESGAAAEQLLATLVGSCVRVRALADEPRALLDGAAFVEAELGPGSFVTIGALRLSARPEERAAASAATKTKPRVSPVTALGALVGLGAAGYLLSLETPPDWRRDGPGADAPALWAAVAPRCPETGRDTARALALDALGRAQAKEERRPFRVEAGVSAVTDYEQALACFAVAGEAGVVRHFEPRVARLRDAVTVDYRAHCLRLERAVATSDWPLAREEAEVLLSYTRGATGDYVAWLGDLRRRLDVELGGAR